MKIKFVNLFIFLSIFLVNASSQVTLEHTYPYSQQELSIINLETIGMKYMVRQRNYWPGGRALKLYNLDHSLYDTLNMNLFPVGFGAGSNAYEILYVSQHLFDNDDGIEFMFVAKAACPYTGIYNFDGSLIAGFDSLGPYVTANFHTYQYPIYNTPLGTKLILSSNCSANQVAHVYGLQGTYSPLITAPYGEVKDFTVYPNPAVEFTIVDYQLPDHINDAYLTISDLNGNQIKSYWIDGFQNTILVNNSEFSSGTYLYTITKNGQILNTKKIEIIGSK